MERPEGLKSGYALTPPGVVMASRPDEKIHAALASILAEFPGVTKDQKNPSQGYNYRGVDDALRVSHPLFAKHRVYALIRELDAEYHDAGQTKSGKDQVRCVVTGKMGFVSGEDGSSVNAVLAGEGIDTGDKAMMKALANGLKYVIWYTFLVPTDEVKDSEAFDDPAPAKAPAKKPRTKSGSGAEELIKKLKACKTEAALNKLRPAARELCLGLPASDPDRAKVIEVVHQQEEKLS
jgi:hypothetical protein